MGSGITIPGQVPNDGRVLGIVVNGLPSAATPQLQFNDTLKVFEWVSAGSGQTFARVVKKVDQTIDDMAYKNDNELFVALNINKKYGFLLAAFIDTQSTQEAAFSFTIPAGATGLKNTGVMSTNGGTFTQLLTIDQNMTGGGPGATQLAMVPGKVEMGGTSGNLQFRHKKLSATNRTIFAGSYLLVWEELP